MIDHCETVELTFKLTTCPFFLQRQMFWMWYIHGKITALSRLKSPSDQWSGTEGTPLVTVQKKKVKLSILPFPQETLFSSLHCRGRHLCMCSKARCVFLPAESWPGFGGTTGMILVLQRWGTSPHSSWAAATAWSPVWTGCGPGWTGWFCPCTVVDAGWFLPAPSGLPLTATLTVIQLTSGCK